MLLPRILWTDVFFRSIHFVWPAHIFNARILMRCRMLLLTNPLNGCVFRSPHLFFDELIFSTRASSCAVSLSIFCTWRSVGLTLKLFLSLALELGHRVSTAFCRFYVCEWRDHSSFRLICSLPRRLSSLIMKFCVGLYWLLFNFCCGCFTWDDGNKCHIWIPLVLPSLHLSFKTCSYLTRRF